MTPEIKGDELVEKFRSGIYHHPFRDKELVNDDCTQCAIICVEEIINLRMINNMGRGQDDIFINEGTFWNEVLNYLKSKQ